MMGLLELATVVIETTPIEHIARTVVDLGPVGNGLRIVGEPGGAGVAGIAGAARRDILPGIMDVAYPADVARRGAVGSFREDVDVALCVKQRVLVGGARVDEQAADDVLVIDVPGAQMARGVAADVGDVVTHPERRVARIAHRVVLVAHVGQVDLEIMRRGAAAQRRKGLMRTLRIASRSRDELDLIGCPVRQTFGQPGRPYRMTPRAVAAILAPSRDLVPLLAGQRNMRRRVANQRIGARQDVAVAERLPKADGRPGRECIPSIVDEGERRQRRAMGNNDVNAL